MFPAPPRKLVILFRTCLLIICYFVCPARQQGEIPFAKRFKLRKIVIMENKLQKTAVVSDFPDFFRADQRLPVFSTSSPVRFQHACAANVPTFFFFNQGRRPCNTPTRRHANCGFLKGSPADCHRFQQIPSYSHNKGLNAMPNLYSNLKTPIVHEYGVVSLFFNSHFSPLHHADCGPTSQRRKQTSFLAHHSILMRVNQLILHAAVQTAKWDLRSEQPFWQHYAHHHGACCTKESFS